jgi:hypothetical protein
LDHIRPWADLKSAGDGVKYIPAGVLKQAENLGTGEPIAEKRRRTRRHKAAARIERSEGVAAGRT